MVARKDKFFLKERKEGKARRGGGVPPALKEMGPPSRPPAHQACARPCPGPYASDPGGASWSLSVGA